MKTKKVQTTIYVQEEVLRKAKIILIIKKINVSDFLNQKLKELVERDGEKILREISKG